MKNLLRWLFGKKPQLLIKIEDRSVPNHPTYIAEVPSLPGVWAAGQTRLEAIGDLLFYHSEVFNVKIVVD